MEIGTRVGAIQSMKDGIVKFYGYGTYQGDNVPSKEINPIFSSLEITNPEIKLDSGDTVWGFECWWGPEEKIKTMIKDLTIEIVKIER